MTFLSFIVLLLIAYLLWRMSDQMPDLIFRLSEIQRDVAELRRRLPEAAAADNQADNKPAAAPAKPEADADEPS
ncbi:MAG: hypothetical protein H6994_05530 [Pseudomonadales bacterium]|nr:hypothetical protein [Pseudomonadales bacterium]